MFIFLIPDPIDNEKISTHNNLINTIHYRNKKASKNGNIIRFLQIRFSSSVSIPLITTAIV